MNLSGFDKEAKLQIEKALEQGWQGRVSSRRHAILQHPSGATVSVPRKMHKRNKQNVRAEIRRAQRGVQMETQEGAALPPKKNFEALQDMYRCIHCGELVEPRSTSGHYVGRHSPRWTKWKDMEGMLGIQQRTCGSKAEYRCLDLGLVSNSLEQLQRERQAMLAAADHLSRAHLTPPAGDAKAEPPAVAASTPEEDPLDAMRVYINKLKAENLRLKEHMQALVALAQEL